MKNLWKIISELEAEIRRVRPLPGRGVVVTSGTNGSVISVRPGGGVGDDQLFLHPWKVWTRNNGGSYQLAVSQVAPNADGTWPTGSAAGTVIQPLGSLASVGVKDWFTAVAGRLDLKLSFATTGMTATIGMDQGAGDLSANPAIVVIPLADVFLQAGSSPAVLERQFGDIILSGALIPPAMAGYVYGDRQMLAREANSGMSLVSLGNTFVCPS